MSRHSRRRQGRYAPAGLAAATLVVSLVLATNARAMCCVCRSCSGAAFCVDGLADAVACSSFCVDAGCPSTVYDIADTCADGCDGAPDAPTATASPTPSATPTATISATATETPTAADTGSPTPTATATATPTPQLAGRITYYNGGGAVPAVAVALVGDTPGNAASDDAGDYGFAVAGPGNVSLQPQKLGQFAAAVTALDATWALQAVAQLRTLSPEQHLAADVTGNGTVSALDATLILQFQAGLIAQLPAGDLCNSDWLFVPVPSPTPDQTLVPPALTGGVCQAGRITLTGFAPPLAGRDFHAVLIGDVTGNWAP